MMKSYIAIQSTLFNGVIDLVGYTDMQGNIRLTHTSIYAYMSRTFPQIPDAGRGDHDPTERFRPFYGS